MTIIGPGAEVEAYDNLFFEPEYWHFELYSYGSLLAYNNDIYRPTLSLNFLLKTFYYDNKSDAYIDVRNNHWGNDSAEHVLERLIWDGNDDPDLKIFVDYMPFSTESLETEKKSMGGFKSMFR